MKNNLEIELKKKLRIMKMIGLHVVSDCRRVLTNCEEKIK